MVSKEEYLDWKNSPVTEELARDLKQGIEGVVGILISRREHQPTDDQYLKGWIKGLVDALEWTPEIKQEEEEEDA
jgi:hypothetical protein